MIQLERRLWTVEEFHRMAETGILHEDDRLELIEGDIIAMSPIGVRHLACVLHLTNLFAVSFAKRALVSSQNPVRLDVRSEPEPDITILKYRDDYYAGGMPTPDDVLLLIEVSDATLSYDRAVKRPLYARAGISEYWIINLINNTIEVHRQPENDVCGETFNRYMNETITPAVFPTDTFMVKDLIR